MHETLWFDQIRYTVRLNRLNWLNGCNVLPRQNLVITELKVTKLLFSNWIYQLIFMKVDNLPQRLQVWSESYQFSQIQH